MQEMLMMAMEGARDIVKSQTVNLNNLANVSTDGFRREIALHEQAQSSGELISKPDFTPGPLRTTGRQLDAAISGSGWFKVVAADGTEALSRRGDFRVDELGQLRNGAGQQIVGSGGPILVPPHASLEIGGDGTISILPLGEKPNTLVAIDQLTLLDPDPASIERGQDGLFRLREGVIAEEDASLRVVSGALEGSNVNAVESLVEMIELARAFESHVKMMKTAKATQEQLSQVMNLN